MGYCYRDGRLVCDSCSHSYGVRKVHCPHRWCPAAALCKACRKTRAPELAEHHVRNGCEEKRAQAEADRELRLKMLASGRFVRCSAMNAGDRVHVLFEGQGDVTRGVYMSRETYAAFPLAVTVTMEEFAAVGELEPAPGSFFAGAKSSAR